jgi:peptidoglycan/xylan/chitin deacetylase (PgdA/CDA1 family)
MELTGAPTSRRLWSRALNRSRDLMFWQPLHKYWAAKMRGHVICLVYHRVDRRGSVPFMDRHGAPCIEPHELAEELQLLKSQGARFMTFADLRRGDFPGPTELGVIVSFDDGFKANYTIGVDVLNALRIPAVFFQSTGLIEAPMLIWEHALYWLRYQDGLDDRSFDEVAGPSIPIKRTESMLKGLGAPSQEALVAEARRLYPTAADVRRAHAAGHELGSHGHNHYPRTRIDEETFEAELLKSIGILASIVGERPQAFAYPFNDYYPQDATIAGSHFKQIATVDSRLIARTTDPLSLPRFTWPGPHPYGLRRNRWVLTGTI